MAHLWGHKIHLFSMEREMTDARACPKKREGEEKEKENHRKWHTSEDSELIFSRLQSTSDVWSSITKMEPLKEFPHGDPFVPTLSSRSLNTTLFMCVSRCVSLVKKAYASKGSKLSEKGKFVLDRRLYAHTHTRSWAGRGEVRQVTAICKSICSLQISFLLWDSEFHNSLAFPGQFPSAIALRTWGRRPILICVSMGQKTESRCVSCQTT